MTTTQKQAIEVTPLAECEWWYAKGKHDPVEFVREVCYQMYYREDDLPSEELIQRLASEVTYETWRFVPHRWDEMMYVYPAKPGSRGSFLATVARL